MRVATLVLVLLCRGFTTSWHDFDHIPPTLVKIPSGKYRIGTDSPHFELDGEGPERDFFLENVIEVDAYEVSNAQFGRFVEETGYVSEGEEFGWSFVFSPLLSPEKDAEIEKQVQDLPWWVPVEGSNWRKPEGEQSVFTTGRSDHPVVQVSIRDAKAFCAWRGMRLPTEEEWEVAARGGLEQKLYPWGDSLILGGKFMCNIWQGTPYEENTMEDGYFGTSPIDSYEPNGYGIYNIVGNVWELVDSLWDEDNTVHRGGSFLCHEQFCFRYRVAARGHSTHDSAASNVGFRCARDVVEPHDEL